jgi:hypothetical protein
MRGKAGRRIKKPERLVIYAPRAVIAALEEGKKKTAFPSMSSYVLSLILPVIGRESRDGRRASGAGRSRSPEPSNQDSERRKP